LQAPLRGKDKVIIHSPQLDYWRGSLGNIKFTSSSITRKLYKLVANCRRRL